MPGSTVPDIVFKQFKRKLATKEFPEGKATKISIRPPVIVKPRLGEK